MKKRRLCILMAGLAILSLPLRAQTNTFPSSGSVGIGTTVPANSLHVNGEMRWGGGTDNYSYSGQDDGGLFLEQSGETQERSMMRFQASKSKDFINYAQFFIDPYRGFLFRGLGSASPNVGIGTLNPLYKLHIEGTNDGTNYAQVYIKSAGTYPNNISGLIFDSPVQSNIRFQESGVMKFQIRYNNASTVNNKLSFYSFLTNADVATFDGTNGNVGIGTSTPAEKLSVNGNIRAHEVKVETANWPDYVFHKGYPLRTLDEVDNFIKANDHLPEVPSAREVSEKGISLGEMNATLLKKIEELTLYLVEQNRELAELKKEVSHLKSKQ